MENELIEQLVKNIIQGNIVSFPTETVYSLSCDINNSNAINKIYKIKNRDFNKLFSVFVDLKFLDNFVIYNSNLKTTIQEELSCGTTIVFNKKNNNVLKNIKGNSIGIRYPRHDFSRKLLKKLGGLPIVATSVNKSGENALCDYNEIIDNFADIDFVVDNNLLENKIISGKPSKIISVVDGDIKIIRE